MNCIKLVCIFSILFLLCSPFKNIQAQSLDTDGDGIPDQFDADDDGDGRDALLEFASGGDPTVAEPASDAVRIEPGTVAFRRNLRAGDLTFELESSDDLLNWRSATDSWEFASEENLGDGSAMFLFRPSGGDDSLYIRQRVKVP